MTSPPLLAMSSKRSIRFIPSTKLKKLLSGLGNICNPIHFGQRMNRSLQPTGMARASFNWKGPTKRFIHIKAPYSMLERILCGCQIPQCRAATKSPSLKHPFEGSHAKVDLNGDVYVD